VTRRNRFAAKHEVALRANKHTVLAAFVYFVIENPAIINSRRDVTTFSTAT